MRNLVKRLTQSLDLGAVITFLVCAALVLTPEVALADALDDVNASLTNFLSRVGLIATGLIVPTGGVTVTVLAFKRQAAKAMGDDEVMARTGNQIAETLKLTAIGTGASLLTAIAGSVLKP